MNGYRRYQQGVVLPLTLIIVATLTMMASVLLMQSGNLIEDGQKTKITWEAELQINAAEQRVLMAIMAGQQYSGAYFLGKTLLRTDGTPIKLSNDVWVSVQDQAGLLSLRFLRQDWLLTLLRSYVKEPLASQILNSIITFQTPNYMQGNNGLAQNDRSSRGALFRSLDELMLIPEITPELYNGHYNLNLDHSTAMGGRKSHLFGLRDLLTISGSSNINYATLPEPILRRVLKLTETEIKVLNEMKNRGNWVALPQKFAEFGWLDTAASMVPSSFYIIRFQYKGIQARGDYQVRSTTIPPRRRAWFFPDNDRYFMDSNRDRVK